MQHNLKYLIFIKDLPTMVIEYFPANADDGAHFLPHNERLQIMDKLTGNI